MQDNNLKDWYKSSFESMQGKPVPDVWDAVEAALPVKKYIWLKRSTLLLIPLALIGLWMINDSHQIDYFPREEESTIASLNELFDAELTQRIASVEQHKSNQIGISEGSNTLNQKRILPGIQKQDISTVVADKVIPGIAPNQDRQPFNEGTKLDFQELFKIAQLSPQRLSFNFDVMSNAIDKPVSSNNNYLGFNVGLYNVTMLNNQFFKAMDKETMSSNSAYLKPTYSILFGTEIKNNLILEFSASHTNLGQAVSNYEEGVFVKTQESLSYVSFGAGIVKQNPITEKFSTYYGTSLEGRFLMKEFSQLSDEFSTRDFAIGAKGGGKIQATKNVSIGAGVAVNMSILNTFKGTSKIPKSFNSTRNVYMGVDLSVAYSF